MSEQQSRRERAEAIVAANDRLQINKPETLGHRMAVGAVEAVLEQLEQAEHERNTLAEAIREATVKAGICRADAALTGPHLVMLASDMADCIEQQRNELHQVLVDVRTMAGILRGREWAEHGCTHQDTQDLETAISGMVGQAAGGALAPFDQAAAVIVKMTAPPRDLLGAPTAAMKATASLGERIAAAVRALKPTAALDDGELARLRRVVRALGMEKKVPEDDATLRGCLFSVLGLIAGKLERAAQVEAPAPATGVLCVGVAAPKGATISVIQKKADGTAVVLCGATLPAGDSMCSLNLGSFASFAKTAAAHDVLVERWRQVEAEGYEVGSDDGYVLGELGAYAAFYAMPPAARDWPAEETGYGATWGEAIVPADWTPPKPGDRRRELVKAGALVLAEIERMDRAGQGSQ